MFLGFLLLYISFKKEGGRESRSPLFTSVATGNGLPIENSTLDTLKNLFV